MALIELILRVVLLVFGGCGSEAITLDHLSQPQGFQCSVVEAAGTKALATRARFYASLSDYDAAIAAINAALEHAPRSPELYTLRGQMYLALYEWDNALADFNTALEHRPGYAEAYYQRGLLYYSILQTGVETRPDALADFQRYLELASDGDYADEAARYAASIEAELEALAE